MGHRRYKCGLNPEYDRVFDRLKGDSALLNPWAPGTRGMLNPDVFAASSREGLLGLILEYEGEPCGEHQGQFQSTMYGWQDSRIKMANNALLALDEAFAYRQDKARRSGWPPAQEWPPELLKKKLRAEAAVDIVSEELDALRKELKKYAVKEQKVRDSRILQYGPRGDSAGEPPRHVDYQGVAVKDGELIIDCELSPYHQMRLVDYYTHIVPAWHQIVAGKDAARLEAIKGGANPNELPGGMGSCPDPADFPPRPEGL